MSNFIFYLAMVFGGGMSGIFMSWLFNRNKDVEMYWIGAWMWSTFTLAIICEILWEKAGGFIGFM